VALHTSAHGVVSLRGRGGGGYRGGWTLSEKARDAHD